MDDSSQTNDGKFDSRMHFGMDALDVNERQQFGQNVRLTMECMEGIAAPTNTRAMPSDEAAIRHRLKVR